MNEIELRRQNSFPKGTGGMWPGYWTGSIDSLGEEGIVKVEDGSESPQVPNGYGWAGVPLASLTQAQRRIYDAIIQARKGARS